MARFMLAGICVLVIAADGRPDAMKLRRPFLFDPPDQTTSASPQARAEQRIEKLSKVLREQPGNARAYHDRGRAYGELGEFKKAAADFSTAISRGLDAPWAFANHGMSLILLESFDEAIEALSKAIDGGLSDPRAFLARGYAYFEIGRVNRAAADLTKAIPLLKDAPDLANAYYLRGKAFAF